MLRPLSFKRHGFPPEVIRHAIWLQYRFGLSPRDVEALLAEHGVEASYETIRRWAKKFGPAIARSAQSVTAETLAALDLDEMACRMGDKHVRIWRAADDEGEVLDILVQRRRNTDTARKFLTRLLRGQPIESERLT